MSTTTAFRRALLLLLLLVCAGTAAADGYREEEDREYELNHKSLTELRTLLRADIPFVDRTAETFEQVRKDLALDVDMDRLVADPERFRRAATAAAEVYRAGHGFEAVQEAFKRGSIDLDGSRRIALVRNEMLSRAVDALAARYGIVGMNNFSLAESVKSDIDFTLFARWFDPKYVVPMGPDRKVPDGALLKREFYEIYEDMWRISAEKMEIAAHAAEATVPDWRNATETSKFALEYRKGVQALIGNPEAYFLEGAFRMQVDRRTFSGKKPLFSMHIGNLAGEGVDRYERYAREAVYRKIAPEARKGYAFGATVGNYHFFCHHAGDPLHFTKYVLRSVEDGMRLLHLKETDVVHEWKDWKDLPEADRERVLRQAYPEGSVLSRAEVKQILEKSVLIRASSADYGDFDKKWRIWGSDAEAIWRERLGPDAVMTAEDKVAMVTEAEARFEKRCAVLMVENCIETAKARAADFTDSDRMVARMRERGLLSEEVAARTQSKNLKLATYYELYIAFHQLDEGIRSRIVDSAEGEAKKLFEKVAAAVEVKDKLFRFPGAHGPHGDPKWYEKLAARWDAEMLKLRAIGFTLSVGARQAYDVAKTELRMRNWTRERLGKGLSAAFDKLVSAKNRMKAGFEPNKAMARLANLGNVDSLLRVIRVGQEQGFDSIEVWKALGWEVVYNIPYVAPLMTGKAVLWDDDADPSAFLGGAVLVGAYFWPVVGQVYLIGSITYNAVEILDHRYEEGLVDLMLDGLAPWEAEGPVHLIQHTWEDVFLEPLIDKGILDDPNPQTFMSVLRAVPGGSREEWRKGFFAFVDADLGAKLKAAGYDPLVWDQAKEGVIESYMSKWLHDFRNASGAFAGDRELAKHWASDGSKDQRYLLDQGEFSGRLIDRMSRMYVKDLHARSLREGVSLRDEIESDALSAAAGIAAFEDYLEENGRGLSEYLAELTGLVDYPDRETAFPPVEEPEPKGRVTIVAERENARLEEGQRVVLVAKVEEMEGQFTKPFHHRWSFDRPGVAILGETLGFIKADCGAQPPTSAIVKLVVRDSSGSSFETGRLVGEASIEIGASGVRGGSGEVNGGGSLYLVKVTAEVPYYWNAKIGEPSDLDVHEYYTVRIVTPRRPLEAAMQDAKEEAAKFYPEAVVIKVEPAGGPFTEVPAVPPKQETRKEGAGPTRQR